MFQIKLYIPVIFNFYILANYREKMFPKNIGMTFMEHFINNSFLYLVYFLKKTLSLCYVCVFACVYGCVLCVYLVPLKVRQKRVLDPLELELQMFVTDCVVLGTKSQSSARTPSAFTTEPFLQPGKTP